MTSIFDFRDWLTATGLTQTDAATALGVSVDYVSMLAADPGSSRFRPASKAIRRKCHKVARDRILLYASLIVKLSEIVALGEDDA